MKLSQLEVIHLAGISLAQRMLREETSRIRARLELMRQAADGREMIGVTETSAPDGTADIARILAEFAGGAPKGPPANPS
jgi:hypothetical protein